MRDTPAGRALVDALRGHDWKAALYEGRDRFVENAELWLFGHAAMEKLVAPRKAITVHSRVVWTGEDWLSMPYDARRDWLDTKVAQELANEPLTTAGFTPLPVLGVPGWWEPQDRAFYEDASVFRPKRRAE